MKYLASVYHLWPIGMYFFLTIAVTSILNYLPALTRTNQYILLVPVVDDACCCTFLVHHDHMKRSCHCLEFIYGIYISKVVTRVIDLFNLTCSIYLLTYYGPWKTYHDSKNVCNGKGNFGEDGVATDDLYR